MSENSEEDEVHHAAAAATEGKNVAENETARIRATRWLTLIVLVGAALVVSLSVFRFMKKQEEDAFHQQFLDWATRLADCFQASAKMRLQVLDMLAVSLTSSALRSHHEWPLSPLRTSMPEPPQHAPSLALISLVSIL